jgi:hypothetical protein
MTTDQDATRIVRSWLRTDEHESADRVLDTVLALLDATPQRRPLWPARRFADMNAVAKIAVAAAAVVVVGVVGINLLPASGGVGGGAAVTASPTPSPSPTPQPTPSPGASPGVVPPPVGGLQPGTYSMRLEGVPFSLQLTTPTWENDGCQGCASDEAWISRGALFRATKESAMIGFSNIDGAYTDPCGGTPGPRAGSIAELAAAVAAIPGVDVVTPPTDITVGGYPAKHVAISIPQDIACSPRQFRLWYDDAGCGGNDLCSRWVTVLGETNRVWIVDVNGAHFWIEAETYEDASAELEQEVEQIVSSIQFE